MTNANGNINRPSPHIATTVQILNSEF